jgi:ubiquinone/menaquinone biosynthesis C-methylase UbiE/uncharacterized protein YbaR (Trm112 family)
MLAPNFLHAYCFLRKQKQRILISYSMKKEHLKYLVCPDCKIDLTLKIVTCYGGDSIEEGSLTCSQCGSTFKISKHIPRFVPLENYASGFGLQWIKHARTQYDSYSGLNVSEKRFFEETKWARQLPGQTILEVGSGSGRFTEQAASTGAMVVSLDYSRAVEANYASNGEKENVLIVQGDIYRMPFREKSFDKLFCIGVLQHTPQVEKSFFTLTRYLKPGGSLVVDVYKKKSASLKGLLLRLIATKSFVRPITRRMKPEKLYNCVESYVTFMWPLARILARVPRIGRSLNWLLLVADYHQVYDLSDEILREWAILDTFDMLSPRFDYPQSLQTVQDWFKTADLRNVEVAFGYNGIEGRGIKPN